MAFDDLDDLQRTSVARSRRWRSRRRIWERLRSSCCWIRFENQEKFEPKRITLKPKLIVRESVSRLEESDGTDSVLGGRIGNTVMGS